MSSLIKLHKSQQLAFEALQSEQRSIANMPTGWGKSLLICCLSAAELREPQFKVILCVPQRIIAKGFKKSCSFKLPDGTIVQWKSPRNLCANVPAKVAQLVDFIRSPASGAPENRVVLTTHASLSTAFSRLEEPEIAVLFKNTMMVIDEAHHIHSSEIGRNRLGKALNSILDANVPTTKLILATAYFFRGDKLPIIDEQQLSRFHRHHVPFDEYWKSLKDLKTYSYDFIAFKGTLFNELSVLLKKSAEPTIIYCPPVGHRTLLSRSKEEFVECVVEACEKNLKAKRWSPKLRVTPGEKVVIDLVSTEFRSEKIQYIEEHGDQVVAVLTVGMFREGADWKQASRVLDLVPSCSDQDRLQRFGRLSRDYPGKKHVSYYSFFPFVVEDNEETRRRELTKLYAHFHASLVLENAIHPIKFKVRRPRKSSSSEVSTESGVDLFGQLGPNVQEAVIRESYESLGRIQDEQAKHGKSISPQMAGEAVVAVLKANGATDNLESTAKQVLLLMRSKSNIAMNADDLVKAGFDKVWSSDIFDGLIAYSAKFGGPDTLAEIRQIIHDVFEQQWMVNYDKVKTLPQPPRSQTTAYNWCTHNRVLHKNDELSPERIQLLERITWWRWAEGFGDRWQTQFDEISKMSGCPKADTSEYAWVRQQRRMREEGKLESNKVNVLESISWWSWATIEVNWQSKFEIVAALSARPVRGTAEYDWVRTQIKQFNAGKLSAERTIQLETIPWWQWGEGVRSRDDGLACLTLLITEGVARGRSKAEIAAQWSAQMNLGQDQIHKYRRLLPDHIQGEWKKLKNAWQGTTGARLA